tara:strand:- start:267 stop:497 length:231 start_codon:yes stop_codon:yes gene_type:complete
MKRTRQTTFSVKGEKVSIKARRIANNRNFRYSVSVNGKVYKIAIPIVEIATGLNGEYNTLGIAMEKGFAKWLNETH